MVHRCFFGSLNYCSDAANYLASHRWEKESDREYSEFGQRASGRERSGIVVITVNKNSKRPVTRPFGTDLGAPDRNSLIVSCNNPFRSAVPTI